MPNQQDANEMWVRTNQKGTEYMSGKVNGVDVVCFRTRDGGGKRPGWRDLTFYRDDLWAVLSAAPHEAAAVLVALRAGTVDGSTYSGECACLVGTIANARGCDVNDLGVLVKNSGRPAEMWFAQIAPGQTPENHVPAKLAAEWTEAWITRMQGAFGPAPQAVA